MPRHIPTLIDCDPGVDDALALLLACGSPELDLQAVTCVAGNRPLAQTAINARRVLDVAGAHHVPVYAGSARPLAQSEPRCNLVHGKDGLGGVALPERGPVARGHGVEVLLRSLLELRTGTLHVVALGPLTNLALAELHEPGVLRRAEQILVMGGAAFHPGNVSPHAEFNFHADALAADIVLRSGANLQVFPLDVTSQAVMTRPWIDSLATLPGASARAAHGMLAAYADADPLLHDVCPVAALIAPSLFSGDRYAMGVEWRNAETEGRLEVEAPDADKGGDAVMPRLLVGVDADALLALVRERIARLL